MNIITTPKERRQSGIGINYVDAYNQAQMTDYNNRFNEYMWQKQMEYNSPSAQVARLKAAGLNPNYQAVDAGNVSSAPTSSGNITPSVGKNTMAQAQNSIAAFNAFIKSIHEGVQTVSDLSGIPDDISGYRKLLSSEKWNDVGIKSALKYLRDLEVPYAAYTKLGIDLGHMFGVNDGHGGTYLASPDWEKASLVRNLGLKNEDMEWLVKLRKYDFEVMKPEEKKLLMERADLVAEQAGLTGEQSRFFGAIATTKIGAMIAPLVLAFFKML